MQTMHPTLLIGPADWNPEAMPRAEFDRRIAALWRDHPDAQGAIVFGSPHDHAELAYLTHFTPKLEAALALIPRNGASQLLVGGGVNMIPAARPLTWVEQLVPLRNAGRTVAAWCTEHPGAVLIGVAAMPWSLWRELEAALGGDIVLADATPALRRHMRTRSSHELAAIREACRMLAAATAALDERWRAGDSVTTAIIAAEHAAAREGAQDVRSLFSLDGGKTLVPFDQPDIARVHPLQAYFAVKNDGYWAEGFVSLRDQPSGALRAAFAALMRASERVRPGATFDDLDIAGTIAPFDVHPIVREVAVPIGLAFDGPPGGDPTIVAGDVISLRAGVTDGNDSAIVSTMIAVTASGADVLWSAA